MATRKGLNHAMQNNDETSNTTSQSAVEFRGRSDGFVNLEHATGPCAMGVGCDEAGVCFASANGAPERCPRESRLEARFVICSDCGGEGIWDVPTGNYSHLHGGLITETRRCSTCGGSGQVEEEPLARTADDLDRERAAIAKATGAAS